MAQDATSFDEVEQHEHEHIAARRQACGVAHPVDRDGRPTNLFGVALSGGGIRAGAFALGALETLSKRDLLRHVDYLSSVSGGGFAAATLQSAEHFTEPSQRPALPAEVVSHVRSNASYLAPSGLFTRSGLALVVTYLFGLALNLAYYLALTGWVVMVPLYLTAAPAQWVRWPSIVLVISPALVVIALGVGRRLRRLADENIRRAARARERRWLCIGAAVIGCVGAYWGLRAAIGAIWGTDAEYFATHSDLREPLISMALGLVAAVPVLIKMVLGVLQDPKLARRLTMPLLQALALAVLAFAFALHVAIWLRVRLWFHQDALAAPLGWKVDPDSADAGNAAIVLFAVWAAVWLIMLGLRRFVAYEHVSLHYYLRDRIAGAFVFRERFTPDASLALHDLTKRTHWPYPIFNATMNISGGLLTADSLRRARPFELTPGYCGFGESYRDAARYAGGITVATATAISAAAIAPRMGIYTRFVVRVLTSVLNLRLGVRMPNPRNQAQWTRMPAYVRPKIGGYGYTETSKDCYLSDGGHFENLGIYALLRRRCRFILAIDAEADGDSTFSGLGALTRFARADLGCEVSIDVSALAADASGLAGAPCAIGRVRYAAKPGLPDEAIIVYVKAGVVAGLSPDVVAYRAKHARFPHEGTGNQFFDEQQFEAYRRLGAELLDRVLGHHLGAREGFRGLARLFVDLRDAMASAPPSQSDMFQRTTDRFIELETTALEGKVSRHYDKELYPEVESLQPDVHFILSQIQLMEQVYLGCHLERQHDHPDNAGWMRLFERYAASPRFREVWERVGDIFGTAFHRFCERRLGLPLPRRSRLDVVALDVPLLRGTDRVYWNYEAPRGGAVGFQVTIEDVDPGTPPAERWREVLPVTQTPWLELDRRRDGHVRFVVRAVDRADHRELAIGELATLTYRDSMSRIVKTRRLVAGVHVDPDGTPFCGYADDGSLQGFDIDLLDEICKRLGVGIEPVPQPYGWPQILDQPGRHGVDVIIASISISPERERAHRLRFTDPYLTSPMAVVHGSPQLKKQFDGRAEDERWAALRIGAHQGTAAGAYLDNLGVPAASIVQGIDNAELVRMLESHALDAVVCDTLRSSMFGSEAPTSLLRAAEQRYALAVASLNVELGDTLNGILKDLRASGWLDELRRKHGLSDGAPTPRAVRAAGSTPPPSSDDAIA